MKTEPYLVSMQRSGARRFLLTLTLLLSIQGCGTMEPLATVDPLDLERFMGDWYVIAHIPPFLTDDAYNGVERYRLTEDGTVDVLYTYRAGSFDGELKTATPTGFPDQGDSDGEWGMRFVWPFKSDYRIAYLDEDYQSTIVGRNKRDYVWLMARTPSIGADKYEQLVQRIATMGYNIDDLRKMPQQPLSDRDEPKAAKSF